MPQCIIVFLQKYVFYLFFFQNWICISLFCHSTGIQGLLLNTAFKQILGEKAWLFHCEQDGLHKIVIPLGGLTLVTVQQRTIMDQIKTICIIKTLFCKPWIMECFIFYFGVIIVYLLSSRSRVWVFLDKHSPRATASYWTWLMLYRKN